MRKTLVNGSRRIGNAQRAFAAAVLGALMVGGSAVSAYADVPDPTDPLGGSGDSFFTTAKDYLTTHLIPAVIGLTLVGLAVGMLIKWGKKATKSA
jgi:hypothetical protein